MSILNKYKRWKPQLLMILDKYWDFVLSLDNSPSIDIDGELTEGCLISYIDTRKQECYEDNGLCSLETYAWTDAMCDGVDLNNIGFTGIDNGLILFEKDKITNAEFYKIFTESKLHLDDKRLHLSFVSGNTQLYSYDYEEVSGDTEQYIALKGGFLQGFYKIFGKDYQVLPQYIDTTWDMEFVIRPKDYETKDNVLNKFYPENNGIFFYMGTRAENKFMQGYGCDLSDYEDRDKSKLPATCKDFYDCGYLGGQTSEEIKKRRRFLFFHFLNIYGFKDENECGCSNKPTKKPQASDDPCASYNNEGYASDDIKLDINKIVDSEGKPILDNNKNTFSVVTDNKFLTFDRTCDGFTTRTYNEGDAVEFVGRKPPANVNLFLLMNRSCTGYTVDTIDSYYNTLEAKTKCNVTGDIKGNAFALKVYEDGSVGYKYLVRDCDSETGWSIREEKSFPNEVQKDEWNTINVKFQILNGYLDDCGVPIGERKMKIFIYVNGYLKLISQELPEFNFRELDEASSKQEGVPFNISLGGGTQGLCDSIWLDYCDAFDKILPIERNFAGTFIGDIRSFKFYNCKLQYNQIKNNYLYERNHI